MHKKINHRFNKNLVVFCILLAGLIQTTAYGASKNKKPIVNAGKDQIVYSGNTVQLSGIASDPEGGKLDFTWTHPATIFAKVSINNSDQLNASFVAPSTTKPIRLNIVFSVRDPQNAQSSDNLFITIKPIVPPVVEGTTKINDTGVTTCGDYARGHSGISNNDVNCQLLSDSHLDPVPTGQDGASGRDFSAPSDTDGRKGFSFTKLDLVGNALPSSAKQWACVRDNVTGLVWELKTDAVGLHGKNDSFVWYENDPKIGYGGSPGYEKASDYEAIRNDQTCYGFTAGQPLTYCNTKAFVNRVNASGFCGANNWRLPTRYELDSLVSYDLTPSIDPSYFPATLATYYWSSVPYAYRYEHVWAINFQYGGGSPWEKFYNHSVRLVHN